MGLDMYLSRRIYIGGKYERRNVSGEVDIKIGDKQVKLKATDISEIVIDAGYWRKANAIHEWFVKNIQDGEDDCKEYWVSIDTLRELLNVCKHIKNDHSLAKELLPTQTGFFFGSTDYDEYYFQDIDDTIEIVEACIQYEDDSFYYQASW